MAVIMLLARHSGIHRAIGPMLADRGHLVIPVRTGVDSRIGVSVMPADLILGTAWLVAVAALTWAAVHPPRGQPIPLITLGLPAPDVHLPSWVRVMVLPGPWSRTQVVALVEHTLACRTQD